LGAPSGHKGSSTGCCANDMAGTRDNIMDKIFFTFF